MYAVHQPTNQQQVSKDVSVQRVTTSPGLALLHDLLTKHLDATGSDNAAQLLAEWPTSAERFWYNDNYT